MRFSLVFLAAAAVSAPAAAAWNVAETKHFVIYANQSPKQLSDFAGRLERFDQAVRYATRMDDHEIGLGNRLTVFVLSTEKDVRAIMGDKTGFFAGFYTGRVEGSLVYVPKQPDNPDVPDQNAIFFHEYAHHLMNQDLQSAYPQWYSEGFAEFFSTPKFDRDGSVWLGRPAQGRAYGLFNGPQLPIESVFQGMQTATTNEQRDVFYGRSWLLAHYLLLDPHRRGQLPAYIAAMANGASSLDAARQVFGDPKKLDQELNSYVTKPLLQFKVTTPYMHLGPITVTPLSTGGSQVILARARIKYGAKPDEAEGLAAPVRAIQAQFAGDELVETTLAEVELDAGRAGAAEAAADRALKTNPRNTEAMILKGKAIEERAKDADDPASKQLFDQARASFIAANKIDTEDPEPLYEFYRSFQRQRIRPTANAIAALHYASDLAPQDLNVRMNSAIAYLEEGKAKEARVTLTVIAYSPHGEDADGAAKRMIADIDAGNAKSALLELGRSPKAAK